MKLDLADGNGEVWFVFWQPYGRKHKLFLKLYRDFGVLFNEIMQNKKLPFPEINLN